MHQSTPNTVRPQTLCSRLVVSPRRQPELMSRKPQFSQKHTEIPVLGLGVHPCPNPPKPQIHFMSDNVTSISDDENSSQKNNSCQILPNHVWGTSGANGGLWDGVNALHSRQPTPISFGNFRKLAKISVTREHTKIKVLLVRLWHSNVSAPSARQHGLMRTQNVSV